MDFLGLMVSFFYADFILGVKKVMLGKPAFPPRAPPFRARSCSRSWGCVELLTGRWMLRYRERKAGAMDGCV